MSFLNLMRNRLKPKEVNDALTDVQGRVLPVTTSASIGQVLGLTGEDKTPAWVDGSSLPDTTGATTGQILGLTGEDKTPAWVDSYTPLDYSTLEQDTGTKWIDNRPVYRKTYNISNLTGSDVLEADFENYIIVNASGWLVATAGYGGYLGCSVPSDTRWYMGLHRPVDNTLVLKSGSELNGGSATITLDYVKPASTLTKKRKTTK